MFIPVLNTLQENSHKRIKSENRIESKIGNAPNLLGNSLVGNAPNVWSLACLFGKPETGGGLRMLCRL